MNALQALLGFWILISHALIPPANTTPTNWENVVTSSFFSPSRNREITFAIYTPPGYENSTDRYPVMYFLHGRSGNHFLYWGNISGEVPEADGDAGAWITQLITSGTIPPMIIVTPDDTDGHWGVENETMVTEELIAHIDSNWRTIANRNGRAIEGFSMGGMGANRYAARHPDLYCSTIIMADPGVDPAIQYWEENREEILDLGLAVRLAVGDQDDQLRPMTALHEALTSLEIPHEFEIVPGVNHNFGKLYGQIGVKGLQFHGNCFLETPPEITRPHKVYIPYAPRHPIPN